MASWSSTIELAIGPNAVASLLDMLVFVSLHRIAVETYWVPEVFGEELEQELMEMSRAAMEEDIWAISARVLTPEQQEDLRALICTWHEQHPGHHRTWAIRFGEFSGPQAAALIELFFAALLIYRLVSARFVRH